MESMSNWGFTNRVNWMLAIFASIFLVLSSETMSAQTSPVARSPELEAGINLVQRKRSSEAIEKLELATAKNKEDAEAWYSLGVAYIQKPDMKKAESALKKAIKLQPESPEAHTALSYALMRRGKLGEAHLEAGKALLIQPVNADAHYTLGVINFRLGDRDAALRHAETAIKQDLTFAEAYLLKSYALVAFSVTALVVSNESKDIRHSRYREAIGALEKYLELVPDSSSKDIWQEQIESLKFYSESEPSKVYAGRDVTTRVRMISKPTPEYTSEARDQSVAGTVVLRAVFADDGRVKHILILQAIPGGLTEAAVRAARRIKFVPASKDGKPVSMWMQLEYNFYSSLKL